MTELRSFLGFCSAFRRFIPILVCIAYPWNKMLRKKQQQTFDDLTKAEGTTMETLQERLISAPIQLLPPAKGGIIVDSGACKKQVRAVLLHKLPKGPAETNRIWGQDRLYRPDALIKRQSANALLTYWHSCAYILIWKEVNLLSVRTTPLFNGL